MAVGFASPEPPKHRHQQVGLEQRQRGFDFVGLAWKGGSAGSHILGSDYASRGDWSASQLLGRRSRVCVFKRGSFF